MELMVMEVGFPYQYHVPPEDFRGNGSLKRGMRQNDAVKIVAMSLSQEMLQRREGR